MVTEFGPPTNSLKREDNTVSVELAEALFPGNGVKAKAELIVPLIGPAVTVSEADVEVATPVSVADTGIDAVALVKA
jgi:hypothetical protein